MKTKKNMIPLVKKTVVTFKSRTQSNRQPYTDPTGQVTNTTTCSTTTSC